MLTETQWVSADTDLDDVNCITLKALKSSLQVAGNYSKR